MMKRADIQGRLQFLIGRRREEALASRGLDPSTGRLPGDGLLGEVMERQGRRGPRSARLADAMGIVVDPATLPKGVSVEKEAERRAMVAICDQTILTATSYADKLAAVKLKRELARENDGKGHEAVDPAFLGAYLAELDKQGVDARRLVQEATGTASAVDGEGRRPDAPGGEEPAVPDPVDLAEEARGDEA
jgi:hypothetical protein